MCEGCRDIVAIDLDYGKCKSISIEEGVEFLLWPRIPLTMTSVMLVEYENGQVEEITTVPSDALMFGQVKCYTKDGRPGFLCNKQVVAAIGRAIAELEPFLKGRIEVPTEEEADRILAAYDIPSPPLAFVEAVKTRPNIRVDWMKKWRRSGKLCYMKEGWYEIEKLPDSTNGEKNDQREVQIAKSGVEVALEATYEAKTENQLAHSHAKEKRRKMKTMQMLQKWPKNKAEHRNNQMMLWGGKENLAQYETRKLKTPLGKWLTYHVKVEPNGRMRILDTGENAPYGYFSQSSRYYVLRRNARIARLYSTMAQRALWYACKEQFKGSHTGLLVQLGNRGLIRKISGKYAEMNLGGSTRGRTLIDSTEAYSPYCNNKEMYFVIGQKKLKPSKYTMIIEQAKIKPDSWEACD